MKQECIDSGISIKLGKRNDSFDTLKRLCKEEAVKLLATIEVSTCKKVTVSFWTSYLPAELIGVAIFKKDENGIIGYELDFSETTL